MLGYDSTYLLSPYSPHHSTTLGFELAPVLHWCCSTAGIDGCTSSWPTVLLVDLHKRSTVLNFWSVFSWRSTLRLPDSNIPSKRMAQDAPMITPSYLYILSRWDGLMAWKTQPQDEAELIWYQHGYGFLHFSRFHPHESLSLSFRAACFPLFYCYFWSLFCTTCIDLTRTAVFGDGSLHKVVQMHRKRKQIIGGWNRLMWLHSAVSHLDDRVESGTTSNISKYSLYWFWAIMVPSRDLFIGPSATQVWGQLNFIIESLEDPRYSDILTS